MRGRRAGHAASRWFTISKNSRKLLVAALVYIQILENQIQLSSSPTRLLMLPKVFNFLAIYAILAIEKEEKAVKIKSIEEYNKEQESKKKAEEEKKKAAAAAPKKPVVILLT